MPSPVTKKIENNPEVIERASRRRFTLDYKSQIAAEAEQCSKPGELGALLRREGLHSSTVQRWRHQFRKNTLPSSKKPSSQRTPSQEIAYLKRKNERLEEKLRQAELIIDVQKKVSELMTRSQEKPD